MKNSNKLIFASVCIFALSFMLFSAKYFDYQKNSYNTTDNDNGQEFIRAKNTQNNISKSVSDKEDSISYCLKLNSGKICAYMLYGNKSPLLWNSMELPSTLSNEDISLLEAGIYTDSFEEMCLYFESYAS